MNSPFHVFRMLSDLICLYWKPQLLWLCECLVLSCQEICFSSVFPELWFLQPFQALFHDDFWPYVVVMQMNNLWMSTPQLPSVLCPVISFYINHNPAHIETPLMRSKRSTSLCSGLEGIPRLPYPQSSSNFLQGFPVNRESEHDFSLF